MIFYPAGAIGFNFNVDTHGGSLIFQCFRSHISMSNARRASGNTDDEGAFRRSRFFSRRFFSSSFGSRFRSFRFKLFCFGLIDNRQVLFRRLSLHQRIAKIIIHQHTAQAAQYFQMNVGAAGRCCNQEEEVSRFIIEAFIIDAVADDHRCQARFVYGFRFSMRNGNAFANSRTAFGFTSQYAFFVQRFVIQITAGIHEVDEVANGRCLIGNSGIKVNALLLE